MTEAPTTTFGQRLEELRHELKMTKADAHRLLDVSKSTYETYIKGEFTPPEGRQKKLISAFEQEIARRNAPTAPEPQQAIDLDDERPQGRDGQENLPADPPVHSEPLGLATHDAEREAIEHAAETHNATTGEPVPPEPSGAGPDVALMRWNRDKVPSMQGKRFGALVTAATQEQLDHPRFAECCALWGQLVGRARVMIPASARIDEPKGVNLVRHTSDRIMLRDVLDLAGRSVDALHRNCIICDPLTMFSEAALALIDPQLLQRHNLGNAYAYVAQAISLISPEGGPLDEQALRWFCCAENATVVMSQYVDRAVPWQAGLWSAWFAGLCQRKIQSRRYLNATGLRAIVSFEESPAPWSSAGLQGITLNPPTATLPELNP